MDSCCATHVWQVQALQKIESSLSKEEIKPESPQETPKKDLYSLPSFKKRKEPEELSTPSAPTSPRVKRVSSDEEYRKKPAKKRKFLRIQEHVDQAEPARISEEERDEPLSGSEMESESQSMNGELQSPTLTRSSALNQGFADEIGTRTSFVS